MYSKTETEYQNPLVIIKEIEDLVGGGTLAATPLASTDEVKQGAIVAVDSSGLLQVFKTAEIHEDEADDETDYKVKKGHEFKVGDFITDSGLAGAAEAITAIDTDDEDYDVLTVGTTLGHAISEAECLVQAAAQAAAGSAALKYPTPEGITKNAVDLTKANQPTGVMVRGTVNESLMPYPVDTNVKALLEPIIRFK